MKYIKKFIIIINICISIIYFICSLYYIMYCDCIIFIYLYYIRIFSSFYYLYSFSVYSEYFSWMNQSTFFSLSFYLRRPRHPINERRFFSITRYKALSFSLYLPYPSSSLSLSISLSHSLTLCFSFLLFFSFSLYLCVTVTLFVSHADVLDKRRSTYTRSSFFCSLDERRGGT